MRIWRASDSTPLSSGLKATFNSGKGAGGASSLRGLSSGLRRSSARRGGLGRSCCLDGGPDLSRGGGRRSRRSCLRSPSRAGSPTYLAYWLGSADFCAHAGRKCRSRSKSVSGELLMFGFTALIYGANKKSQDKNGVSLGGLQARKLHQFTQGYGKSRHRRNVPERSERRIYLAEPWVLSGA